MPVKFRPPNRGRRAAPVTLSAPTGGLNGRDNFTDMDRKDAFLLDNWFPAGTSLITRGGSLSFSTGLPGPVESLETYTGGVGSKLLSFADGEIHDSTLGGVPVTPLATGRSSNQVTSAMFSNAGSQFLLIYSGADEPVSFDGTSIDPLVITGLTGSQNLLFCGMAFKGRMLLGQLGQLGFYYLAIGAIQGAASYFDLQQQSLKGGALLGMVAFSADSDGAGPQDYAVFVTTEGEYIMYAGTDPSNPATWSLVGRYFGPPPLGKKSWFKFRSDVYFLTEEGILSFSQIRQTGEGYADQEYLTAKLGNLFTDEVNNRDTHGWTGMIYPRANMLFVNVPQGGSVAGKYVQFVMNTNTNRWCRFTAMNAICWALIDGRAYFGTNDGKVVLADEGFTDNGEPVQAVCRQAWCSFDDGQGMGEADKHFHFATFAMQADAAPSISCALNVNYENAVPEYATALGSGAGAEWDIAEWDDAEWAGDAVTTNITVPVGKIGYVASLWMQATSVAARIRWYATRVTFERTKGILLS